MYGCGCEQSSELPTCAPHEVHHRAVQVLHTLLPTGLSIVLKKRADCQYQIPDAGWVYQCGHEQPGKVPKRVPQGAQHSAARALQEQLWRGALLLLQAGC